MKSIGIFCGSSMGNNPAYRSGAIAMVEELLANNLNLIYGGANVGLMKVIADTMLAGGGEVIGVMPRILVEKEVAHTKLTDLYMVESMSERKSMIIKLSDAFIVMPGGFGTLDELAEVITCNQLRLADKPIGILNIDHYFDLLLRFFSHSADEGFLRHEHRNNLIIEQQPKLLLEKLKDFQPVPIDKWILDIKEESENVDTDQQ
jgi:uncharacterized protein (TIGR00730 family)